VEAAKEAVKAVARVVVAAVAREAVVMGAATRVVARGWW
jgi:hypothetical protein